MSINERFNEFIKNYVNLDPKVTKKARDSRDNMIDKLKNLINKDDTVPRLYEDIIHFGSFSRKTKCQKLDDIDLMICFNSEGNTANIYDVDNIKINTSEKAETLNNYLDSNGNLSSIKLANKLKKIIETIPEYSNSDIRRNGEAVILNLTSYDWSFDLVVAFATIKFNDGNNYYLIPDGEGNWKRTHPKLDKDYTTLINKKHNGGILEYIRIMKYINNKNNSKIFSSSYLLECFILKMFEEKSIDDLSKLEVIEEIFKYLINNNYNEINDPKNIQGNLNCDDYYTKIKRRNRLEHNYNLLNGAIRNIGYDDNKAINNLQQLFGDVF